MAGTVKKLLVDLHFAELKSELQRRNLDITGMKKVLLERLTTALSKEGYDPATVMIEVADTSNNMDSSGHDNSADLEDMSQDGEEEAETKRRGSLNNNDDIVIPHSEDVELEWSHQEKEMNSEVAEDALVEEEDMENEDGAGEEDQPADNTDAEAVTGDLEDEVNTEDFTDNDMLSEEVENGAGEPVESGEAVNLKTAKEPKKGQNASAAVITAVSGGSVSSSASTSRSSMAKSSPVLAKKSSAPKNTVSSSKSSPNSAKPVSGLKSSVGTKPMKAVPHKVAGKPLSSTKSGDGVQKPGPAIPKSVTLSKQVSTTKSSVVQTTVNSNPNPSSQVPNSNGLKVPNAFASGQTAGTGNSSVKDAAFMKAEDSFDVQVEDTMPDDIDRDLVHKEWTSHNSQTQMTTEGQVADKDASGPLLDGSTATGVDNSVPEQPPATTGEQQSSDAAKDQDSAQKEKPEEKRDEKDANPVKSPTTAKTAKGKDDKAANSRNLWVSGLSSSTRATDLKNLFGKYGKVVGAKVVTNARSPGWRCYGFITMASADETTKCIQHLHRTELHGKMISVERFSSFKAKTGGPAKTVPSSKTTITGRSITGKPTPVTITTTKTTPIKKDDRKTPTTQKEGDKKPVKKDVQEESKDANKDDHSSKGKPDEKKLPRKDEKDQKKPRQGSCDRSRHRDPEKSREQRERDILSFEKIRAERERERLRQKELQLRCEERYRMAELDRERQRQKMISRKQRDEAMQLEREKEKLRMEKERLDFERQEAERLRRETSRLKRIAEEKLRHEQERLEMERRAIKRPAAPPKVPMGDYWGEAAKKPRKEPAFKSLRDRDYQREERREFRGGHRDVLHVSRGMGGNGAVPNRGHGNRESRKVPGSRHSWGMTADNHSKVEAGWGRAPEGNGGSNDRWMGGSSMGSQHQRSGLGIRGMSSSGGGNMNMSSGPSHSSTMSGGGILRQQDTRFNIAAITARRF